MDVKRYFSAKGSVPKAHIIAWAAKQWPAAAWIRVNRKGTQQLTQANEHLADAMATITSGSEVTMTAPASELQSHTTAPARKRVVIISKG